MDAREIAEKLRVVILYDRLESVGRAMAAYADLTRDFECECMPELSIWRLDVATSPEFAVKADYDIAAAEIVLMAVRGSAPCPTAFQHWKERAWQDEGVPPRIWIAIVVAEPEMPTRIPADTTWATTLRSSATQIHPEIFAWEPVDEFAAAEPEPDEDLLEPVAAAAAMAPQVVHADEFSREKTFAEAELYSARHD